MLKRKQTHTHIVGTSPKRTLKNHLFFLHWQKKQHKEFHTVSLFLFETEISDGNSSIIFYQYQCTAEAKELAASKAIKWHMMAFLPFTELL